MTQEGFSLLDEFSMPDAGVCGAFSSEAAMELMQTDDPKRPVGQENMEQQELTVETTDANHPTHAKRAGSSFMVNDKVRILPDNAVDSELIGKTGIVVEVQEEDVIIVKMDERAPGAYYDSESRGEYVVPFIADVLEKIAAGTTYMETVGNAGGGLESNDVVAPDGLPMKAQDEQGGQDMENRENVLSMRQFPGFNDLPERERFLMRLAVMTDSDIAETPVDVLMDALDTIDNRRSDAEPTLEEQGYKTKILEELKNRGVEYKKAEADDDPGDYVFPTSPHGTVDEAYEKFMSGKGNESTWQEEFDTIGREVGLGGREIEELAQRLRNEGFEVEASRKIGGRS